MSIITRSIKSADRQARYLNLGELKAVEDFYQGGEDRLRLAQILVANEAEIVNKGSQRFWQRYPNTPSNTGNPTFRASCLRDQGWYLRLITYALVLGDTEPIDKSGIKGVKEMYQSLEIPLKNLAECMRCLKEVTAEMLSLKDAAAIAPYFDYIIQGFL
ncbi:allophycocyanin [Pleurocapsa sp. CCALA 161]|uniref:allophycocyanin subunit alpha-B n=1 Tax=Pleurocapsa sp. CCALA 161 TaxID=2107688 RepID=UPI000D0691CC|nr:allophycocyanin subunit alpha-B [Pleurocapsa sp. CCALA 161]PSB09973.1 allophycocyanin [Pleurocapsa sp. CCALA 161]